MFCSCDKCMPIFSFTGCTLTELFIKPDNRGQIYKQTSSTFYQACVPLFTSNMSLKRVEKRKLLGRHNKDIF